MTDWNENNKQFVETFQRLNGINDDGEAGDETFTKLDARNWPLRNLTDGRQCFVTNPYHSVNHKGIDVFQWWQDGDPLQDGYWTPYAGGKVWYPFGTRAYAACDGLVTFADEISTGILVTVKHANGETTGYFHGEDEPLVNKGDTVKRGDDLIVCGWDTRWPLSEGNPVHLHFSVKDSDGYYRNPVGWLQYATYLYALKNGSGC